MTANVYGHSPDDDECNNYLHFCRLIFLLQENARMQAASRFSAGMATSAARPACVRTRSFAVMMAAGMSVIGSQSTLL